MAPKDSEVLIPRIQVNEFEITIEGTTPLITHRFSDRNIKMIEDKQQGNKVKTREVRDPEAEYMASMYFTEDGEPGFPASGIKQACVGACRFLDITMTWARGAFFILGDILPLEGKPRMRTDMVRIGRGSADIRYRAEFPEWSIAFKVRHNPDITTTQEIVNLIESAGFYIGIGDWRPEKSGTFGMFRVREQ